MKSVAMVITLCVAAGCDAVDYYPRHEGPQQAGDLRKDGPGTYGGNNGNYPVGTPGTTGSDAPPTNSTVPTAATPNAGPAFNTNGQGTFTNTGSYSGANVGGSTSGNLPNQPGDGTSRTGTAGGH